MKLNDDKLVSDYKHKVIWAKNGNSQIWERKEQKLLELIIVRNMKFDECILKQYNKA